MDGKKIIMTTLVATMLIGNTMAFANENNSNIETELLASKKKVEHVMYSKDFDLLPIEEKAIMVKKYYDFHSKLYDVYSNQVNTEVESKNLYNLKEKLIINDKEESKVNQLVLNAIKSFKANKNNSDSELQKAKRVMRETLLSQKEVREKGRKLEDKIFARMNLLNFNKSIGLERIAKSYESDKNIKEAVGIYIKILELNNGESQTIEKISELMVRMGKKAPLFIENKVFEVSNDFKTIDGVTYIATKSLQKIDGFLVDWEASSNSAIIKHRENIIKIPIGQNKIFFNDVVIDTQDYLLLEGNTSYIPLRSLFEILSYSVSWNNKAEAVVISRTSYKKTEIDDFSVDELLNNMFN